MITNSLSEVLGKIKKNSFKIWYKTIFSLSPFLFNIVLKILGIVIREEKDINSIQIVKYDAKLSLSSNDIILSDNPPPIFISPIKSKFIW